MKKPKARHNLLAISEEMKAWSAALAAEVGDWPEVSVRSFFGFTALYLGDRIFAALPRTRGIESANSLAFKLEIQGSTVSASQEGLPYPYLVRGKRKKPDGSPLNS